MQRPVVKVKPVADRLALHEKSRACKIIHLPGNGAAQGMVGVYRLYIVQVVSVRNRVARARAVGLVNLLKTAVGQHLLQVEVQVMEELAYIGFPFLFVLPADVSVSVLKVELNRQGKRGIAPYACLHSQDIAPELQVRFGRKFLGLDAGAAQERHRQYQPNSYFWYGMQFQGKF